MLTYEFGPFRFEPEECRLLCEGRPVPLPPQGVEALRVLIERRGSLVTKGELLELVWPDRAVEENSLTKCISILRKAIGDEPIETIAKRGYRFIAEVRQPSCPSLAVPVTGRERRRRSTRDAHAYRLYREARCQTLRYTSAAWRKGTARFELAIEQDRSYALAHADLAISSVLAGVYYTPSAAVQERAREAARRAVAIDPGLAEGHLATALVRCLLDWNWEAAECSFHQALALDPRQAWSHDYYGFFLTLMGRFREALPSLERAIELNPVRIAINGNLVRYHHCTGGVERSLEESRRSLDLDPFCGLLRVEQARTLERAGRLEDAIAELRHTQQLDDVPWVRVWLARACGLAGRTDEARGHLHHLQRAADRGVVSPVFPALVEAVLGERKEALARLDAARAQRSPWIAFLRADLAFDALREEPGFRALLRRVGFG